MFVTLNDILIVRDYSTNCIFVSAIAMKYFNILYYTILLLSLLA